MAIGVLLLACAAGLAVTGHWVLVPQCLLSGLALTAGIAWERWHYTRVLAVRPDTRWVDTAERFIDPASGRLVAVFSEPGSGKRHYVGVDAGRGA
jgi:hypothetical protein